MRYSITKTIMNLIKMVVILILLSSLTGCSSYKFEYDDVIDSDDYYVHYLDDNDKSDYNSIKYGLKYMEDKIFIKSDDIDELMKIYEYVLYDNPEIFYTENFDYVTIANKFHYISPIYIMTLDEIEEAQNKLNEYTLKVCSTINKGDTQYEIEKKIFNYISLNTEYDLSSESNQNLTSVMNGKSVCLGYSKMFKYLLNMFDIQCVILTGRGESDIKHAWNCVNIDGKWCMADVTNSYGTLAEDKVYYHMFNVTEKQFKKFFSIDKDIEIPECTSIKNEYFYRNNLYFKEVDINKFSKILDKNKHRVILKCNSKKTLNKMKQQLIDNEVLYDLLDGFSRIQYVKDDDALTLEIIW